jgi:probable rRNA maturation factor
VAARGLPQWLASVAPVRVRGEVAVALASDAEVRALNRRYRRKDQATDVLSFPAEGGPAKTGDRSRVAGRDHLGDLVIATGVARRQAAAAGHSYTTELKVLALHGLLHLLGYDHHAADDNGRMARVEARLRRRGGLHTGLIERAGGVGRAGMQLKRKTGVESAAPAARASANARARARGGGTPRAHK